MWPYSFLQGNWKPGTFTQVRGKPEKSKLVDFADKSHFRQCVEKDWWFWRPVVYRTLTYTEAAAMDQQEIFTANAALDKKQEEDNKRFGGKR